MFINVSCTPPLLEKSKSSELLARVLITDGAVTSLLNDSGLAIGTLEDLQMAQEAYNFFAAQGILISDFELIPITEGRASIHNMHSMSFINASWPMLCSAHDYSYIDSNGIRQFVTFTCQKYTAYYKCGFSGCTVTSTRTIHSK